MKLKKFQPTTTHRQKDTACTLSMNAKFGSIRLSAKATELLGVTFGDHLEFSQDEENPQSWYIRKAEEGLRVRAKTPKETDQSPVIQSTALVRSIFESVEYTEVTGKCVIGSEPIEVDGETWFEVITISLKKPR